MTPTETEPHVWVSKPEECNRCNYDDHTCHFCGEGLDHEGFEPKGVEHTLLLCRPDLVEHEVGKLCTWPAFEGEYAYLNEESNRPGCYAYQDIETQDWGTEHKHFYSNQPMG